MSSSYIKKFIPTFALSIVILFLFPFSSQAQITGFAEDFNDHILTNWECSSNTFTLTEVDGVLKIDYHRTISSSEWDNFNFSPPLIDASDNLFISIRAKSNIATELTLKPIYHNGLHDWLQIQLPKDNNWHTYTFELSAAKKTLMNRIYIYLDAGSTNPAAGIIYFDDLQIGNRVYLDPDLPALEYAIQTAIALHDNSTEGIAEESFPIGSKAILQTAINNAQTVYHSESSTYKEIDSAISELYDTCMTFESKVIMKNIPVVDGVATKETKYLFLNLIQLAKTNLLFGHQDDLAYGIGWWDEAGRSDVYEVCGSYPAIYGWDIGKIELANKQNLDGVAINRIQDWIREAYERGGISTVSWHSTNPLSGGNAWDKTRSVHSALPGGVSHEKFKLGLDRLAKFFKSLKSKTGNSIPIIFRPYHEHTGNWFWWGKGNCSADEFIRLWQFTIHYLCHEKGAHNLLFAYSPAAFRDYAEYLEFYPGDQYVDVLGVDDYSYFPYGNIPNGLRLLRTVVELAEARSKVPTITEIKLDLNNIRCWTEFLNAVESDPIARRNAWMLVWRNINLNHFFAPYPGHPTVPDFMKFFNDPFTLFEIDLPDVYASSKTDTIPPAFIRLPSHNFTAFDQTIKLQVWTNEGAFLRYSSIDQAYQEMPNSFDEGQGGTYHSTEVSGVQGEAYVYYLRAIDVFGNEMDSSATVSFKVDTSQAPIFWHELKYDHESWKNGAAPFGFPGGQIATEISKVRTVYFKHEFVASNIKSITYLAAILKYDNGAVIYLNGQEVARVNLPIGDIFYETWASSVTCGFKAISLNSNDINLLKEGKNVIAVELHQSYADSSDLLFDLRLITPAPLIEFGSSWYFYDEGKTPADQFVSVSVETEDEQNKKLISGFKLDQNYPNPFNSVTAISYQLSAFSSVKLTIFDVLGKRTITLVDEKKESGKYTARFTAAGLSSGIYFYRLETGDFVQTKKMIVLR